MQKKKDLLETGSDEQVENKADSGIPNMDPDEITTDMPEKKPVAEKEKANIDLNLCKAFAGFIPFFFMAQYKENDHYNLTDAEKESLAPLWNDIFLKYLPAVASSYTEEITLATAIMIIWTEKSIFIKKNFPEVPTETKNIQDIPMQNVKKENDITDFEND